MEGKILALFHYSGLRSDLEIGLNYIYTDNCVMGCIQIKVPPTLPFFFL